MLLRAPLSNINPVTDVIRPITLQVADPEKNSSFFPRGLKLHVQDTGTEVLSWICNFSPLGKKKDSVSEG